MPDMRPPADHADDERASTARVNQCAARRARGRHCRSQLARSVCEPRPRNSFQAPEEKIGGEGDDGVGHEVVEIGLPARAREADASMMPLTMTPVGANGESAPACAPLPTISAMRNGGTRPACADRHGHRREDRGRRDVARPDAGDTTATMKNMIGITPALPRQTRTARAAMRPSVPLSFRHAEQQRDARERQEQLDRETCR